MGGYATASHCTPQGMPLWDTTPAGSIAHLRSHGVRCLADLVTSDFVTSRPRHRRTSIRPAFPRTPMPRFPLRGLAQRSSIIAAAMALAFHYLYSITALGERGVW